MYEDDWEHEPPAAPSFELPPILTKPTQNLLTPFHQYGSRALIFQHFIPKFLENVTGSPQTSYAGAHLFSFILPQCLEGKAILMPGPPVRIA